MTPGRPSSPRDLSIGRAIADIAAAEILLICNEDFNLTRCIIDNLREKGARVIKIFYPENLTQYVSMEIDAIKIQGSWESFGWCLSSATIVISMLYNNFDKQEILLDACIRGKVGLFVTWDAGMELEHYITDKRSPRTRLHTRLIEYQASTNNYPDSMKWILLQVGIFDEEILKNDISTITTAFNSPNQYIFLNVTVKEDLAQLVGEVIVSNNIIPNRNYVVGDFVAHTFLGHAYQVVNKGIQLDFDMPADISEFETTNQLRLSGIVSARPLPKILYPGCSMFFHKLGIEISFQHDAIIYKLLRHHRRTPLKSWIRKRILYKPQ